MVFINAVIVNYKEITMLSRGLYTSRYFNPSRYFNYSFSGITKTIAATLGINALAFGGACLHERWIDYQWIFKEDTLQDVDRDLLKPFLALAADVFMQLGVDVKHHQLKIIPLNPKLNAENSDRGASESKNNCIAEFHQTLNGEYYLQVDPDKIKKLVDSGKLTKPEMDYWRAVFAHEAVHAKERHDFWNIYCSVIVGLTAVYFSRLYQFSCFMFRLSGPVSLSLANHFISQNLEFRADEQAAKLSPKIREDLRDLITADQDQEHDNMPPWAKFLFHSHPSDSDRIKRLEQLPTHSLVDYSLL